MISSSICVAKLAFSPPVICTISSSIEVLAWMEERGGCGRGDEQSCCCNGRERSGRGFGMQEEREERAEVVLMAMEEERTPGWRFCIGGEGRRAVDNFMVTKLPLN
jgi:hypothetical protein